MHSSYENHKNHNVTSSDCHLYLTGIWHSRKILSDTGNCLGYKVRKKPHSFGIFHGIYMSSQFSLYPELVSPVKAYREYTTKYNRHFSQSYAHFSLPTRPQTLSHKKKVSSFTIYLHHIHRIRSYHPQNSFFGGIYFVDQNG